MRVRSLAVMAAILAVSVGMGVASASARAQQTAGVNVKVTATEFKFAVTPVAVKHGIKVAFHVTNKGQVAHDFKIGGKKTRLLEPGQSATLAVSFAAKGTYAYSCTVPGHAQSGMRGTLQVT
jgi:uncharacterized cupredoxin-like copper-binding protein